jgi:hypothetical protein
MDHHPLIFVADGQHLSGQSSERDLLGAHLAHETLHFVQTFALRRVTSRPRGERRQRLSLRAGRMGLLTAAGKFALVTGRSRGCGKAIAQRGCRYRTSQQCSRPGRHIRRLDEARLHEGPRQTGLAIILVAAQWNWPSVRVLVRNVFPRKVP